MCESCGFGTLDTTYNQCRDHPKPDSFPLTQCKRESRLDSSSQTSHDTVQQSSGPALRTCTTAVAQVAAGLGTPLQPNQRSQASVQLAWAPAGALPLLDRCQQPSLQLARQVRAVCTESHPRAAPRSGSAGRDCHVERWRWGTWLTTVHLQRANS